MKRVPLLLTLLAAMWLSTQTSQATISIAANPSTQTARPGGTFNVSLTLSVTQNSAPANVAGFDLYVSIQTANGGFFSIASATPTGPFTSSGPTNPSGGDPLTTAGQNGYSRNGVNQGFLAPASPYPTTPLTNVGLESLAFNIAANTPAGTYTFQTSAANTAGAQYTDILDGSGVTYAVNTPGTFSITVVPEPSSQVLVLGVLALGATVLTVRRRSPATGK